MKTTPSRNVEPASLQDILDLYNNGTITVEELLQDGLPLLERWRSERILCCAVSLISGNPGRYHVSSPHHPELWKDAIKAHEAEIDAELAKRPGARQKIEDACRRAEAKLNEAQAPTE
jgi:hypothetical protein